MKRISNQVDPYGERSLSMGRRTATLTGNAESGTLLSCKMEVQPFSGERTYTRLFFLDEANALAAGHRPCGSCSKTELKAFKAAWKKATGRDNSVSAIDEQLAKERGRPHQAEAESLPNGTMIDIDGTAYLINLGRMKQWTWGGYGLAEQIPGGSVSVITPRSIVDTIAAGYKPRLHESAGPSRSISSPFADF